MPWIPLGGEHCCAGHAAAAAFLRFECCRLAAETTANYGAQEEDFYELLTMHMYLIFLDMSWGRVDSVYCV